MSQTAIRFKYKVDNVLTDPTSVKLSNLAATYGVKRTDNDAVVVADDTSMTKKSTGVYEYAWTDPASDLTYDGYVEVVYGGETSYYNFTVTGGKVTSDNLYGLIPQIAPWVGGVPDLGLKQRLRAIAFEFCRRTEIWRETLTTFVTVADEAEYTLSTSYDAVFLRVRTVEVGDETPDDPNTSGTLTAFTLSEDGVLALKVTPAVADQNIVVKAVMLPKEICTQYPVWFIDRWGDAIVAGTIESLKLMRDKSWSDFHGSLRWGNKYRDEIGTAKRETHTERCDGELRIAIREFV